MASILGVAEGMEEVEATPFHPPLLSWARGPGAIIGVGVVVAEGVTVAGIIASNRGGMGRCLGTAIAIVSREVTIIPIVVDMVEAAGEAIGGSEERKEG